MRHRKMGGRVEEEVHQRISASKRFVNDAGLSLKHLHVFHKIAPEKIS